MMTVLALDVAFLMTFSMGMLLKGISAQRAVPTCFEGNSVVMTETGKTKLVKDLVAGDRVLAATARNLLKYSTVLMQTHAYNTHTTTGVAITTEKGHEVRATKEHLMMTLSDCEKLDKGADSKWFQEVRVGDLVMVRDGDRLLCDRVVQVEPKEITGLFAPMTKEGTIVVNDVVASCYAHASNHDVVHRMFSLLNLLPGRPSPWKYLEPMFQEMPNKVIADWIIKETRIV